VQAIVSQVEIRAICPLGIRGTGMAERIGNVLYWLGCIIAALVAGIGVFVYVAEGHGRSDGLMMLIVFLVLAVVPWLIGRALRYVLSAT
jgi:hypothetical protein